MGVQGHDDVELVEAARTGDPVAFGRLFDRWFDRTYDVAWHIVRNRDTAAEIAQDSFLAAWQQLPTLRQPASFGGWVLRIARNRSLNRLEHERRSTPSGDATVMAEIDRRTDQDDIGADLGDQERDQLIWAAAAALGERDASLLDLHLRHELSAAAIAEELDTSANNVHQLLHRLRGRLAGAIRSWVLWRDGRARCEDLAGTLATAGITRFGADAVRTISAHAADCDVCGETQRAVLAPEALFAAVPIVVAPVALKAQAAAALLQAGVPLGSALSRMAPPSGTSGGGGPSSGSGSSGGGGPPAGSETPAAGTPASTTTATTSTPMSNPAAAAGGAPRSLQALRAAASGRRLVVAGAAVMALVAAAVTGVVLSDGPAEHGAGDDRAAEEADVTADGEGPGGGPGGVDDPSEISATTTPTGVGEGPGSDGRPGGDASGPGGSGGDDGGTGGPVAPGGSGGSGGEPGDPGSPPGGGATTTVPGGSPGSTTTTSTPPDPGADPPDIIVFRAEVGARCGALSLGRTVVLVWASLDADSATLGLLGVLGQDVPPSGSVTRCVLLGDVYLLTVSGPGGQDRARLTIAL